MTDARVRLPAAAIPIKSSRQRVACATTSSGKSANPMAQTNAGTSANAASTPLALRSSGITAVPTLRRPGEGRDPVAFQGRAQARRFARENAQATTLDSGLRRNDDVVLVGG